MPVKLSTTVRKIDLVPDPTNAGLLKEFFYYMQANGSSESHQNNNLKVLTAFAEFLGRDVTLIDIKESHPIIRFLNSKLKDVNDDPERKSIITWNDYLSRIKYFFRWLHNNKEKDASVYQSEWITPHVGNDVTINFEDIRGIHFQEKDLERRASEILRNESYSTISKQVIIECLSRLLVK